jgi:signal transduction histidine kinase
VIAVPLKMARQTTGMIVLHAAAGETLSKTDQHLLETLAAQASVTLENAHLFEMTLRQGAILEQRASRQAHILETSYGILRLIPQTKELWTQVCHIAQDALDFGRVAIFSLNDRDTLTLRAIAGAGEIQGEVPGNLCCTRSDLNEFMAATNRVSRSFLVQYGDMELSSPSRVWSFLERAGFRVDKEHPEGALLTPIETPTGKEVGYLVLGEALDGRVPAIETIQIVEIFVNQVAIALENARLFAALERRLNQARRVNELAALNRLSTAVASSLETEYIQSGAAAEIAETLHPDVTAIWLPSGEEQVPLPRVECDPESPISLEGPLISPSLFDDVLRGEEPVLLPFASSDAPRDSATQSGLPLGAESAMLAPMVVRGQRVGLIGVFARQRGRFDQQDLALLKSMASTVAIALENARLYSESKAFATELAASQAQLVQSAKLAATGQLAASIAHEINNPLQAVQSCIYLIADSAPSDDPNVKYVSIAREELDRIARIVGRMLDFHHPATDTRQATDVNALIENVLALAHKRLQHSNIVVRTNLSKDLPLITAVSDHIKQVLLNLFLNALEAMPQGGTLVVRTAALPARGDTGRVDTGREDATRTDFAQPWVTITIQDDGLGMSADDISHLFEPFYTTKPRGTGLGLSISYDIVAQHGGDVLVDSELGRGTTFTIRLPASKGARAWRKS